MKKIANLFIFSVIVLGLIMIIGGMNVKAADYNTFHLVTTNPGEDASTMININYHCYKSGSHIEYTLESDENFSNARVIMPSEQLWSIRGQDNVDTDDTFYTTPRYICKASLTGLQVCTKYKYRLVLGDEVSNVYHFTTAGLTNDWSFIAFADFQYGNNKISHSMIRQMQDIADNPPLAVASGDMSDVSGHEKEVTWFLDNPVMQDFIYASAPGDHEYWSRDESPKLFKTPYVYNATFNFPQNGCKESLNSNFYFYYNNVLFVVIDTDDSDTVNSAKMTSDINWFKTTIASLQGTYQYLVVLGHKSLYSAYSNDSRVFSTLRPQWYPVFDQCAVDLVISGHDHMYSRTYKLYKGEVITDRGEDRYKGTYYLDLGSSGDKTRALEEKILTDGLHVSNTPDIKALGYSLGAHIEVTDQDMTVTVYNQYRTVVDQFTILSKHDPLPIDMSGFDQDQLLNNVVVSVDSLTTKKGSLSFTDNEMLKYVKSVKVTCNDEVCLESKVSFNKKDAYQMENMKGVNYNVVFTLNDNTQVSKQFSYDYWKASNIKVKDDDKFVLTWSPLIGNLSEYSWKVYDGDNLIKTLASSDLMNGNIALGNEFLIGNRTFKIALMLGEQKVDEYTFTHEGAEELTLSKSEVSMNVGETAELEYDFEYDNLVKVEVSDPTVVKYKDGTITALKEGTSEIIFKINRTDYSYKCLVTVNGAAPVSPSGGDAKGGGCNGKSATEILGLFSMLALAILIRKKTFHV